MPQKALIVNTQSILKLISLKSCLKSIRYKNKCCLVAEENGLLVAYCEIDFKAIHPDSKKTCAKMTILYVSEHFYGQGIGKALVLEAEKHLSNRESSSNWLSCFIENQRVIDFYNHLGFKSNSSIYFTMGDKQYENLIFQKVIKT